MPELGYLVCMQRQSGRGALRAIEHSIRIEGHFSYFFLFRSGFPINCSYLWNCPISKGTLIIIVFFHDLFTAVRFYLSGKHLTNSFQSPVNLFFFNDKGRCEPDGISMCLFTKNPQNLQFFSNRPGAAFGAFI